jgi:hypothetical protein
VAVQPIWPLAVTPAPAKLFGTVEVALLSKLPSPKPAEALPPFLAVAVLLLSLGPMPALATLPAPSAMAVLLQYACLVGSRWRKKPRNAGCNLWHI